MTNQTAATATMMYITKNVGTPGMNCNRWKTTYRGADISLAFAAARMADADGDFAEVYEFVEGTDPLTHFDNRIWMNQTLTRTFYA